MKTGILRDDITVVEWERCGMASHTGVYVSRLGDRLRIDDYKYPESWYTDIKEDHKPCPRCGGDNACSSLSDKGYYIYCYDCRISTRHHNTPEAAWEDWDKDYD